MHSILHTDNLVDCKTVGVFLKISKEIGKAWYKSLAHAKRASVYPQSRSLFSASFQTLCLTACAYLNTQKYRLFCSLIIILVTLEIAGIEYASPGTLLHREVSLSRHYDNITTTPNKRNTFNIGIFHQEPNVL